MAWLNVAVLHDSLRQTIRPTDSVGLMVWTYGAQRRNVTCRHQGWHACNARTVRRPCVLLVSAVWRFGAFMDEFYVASDVQLDRRWALSCKLTTVLARPINFVKCPATVTCDGSTAYNPDILVVVVANDDELRGLAVECRAMHSACNRLVVQAYHVQPT